MGVGGADDGGIRSGSLSRIRRRKGESEKEGRVGDGSGKVMSSCLQEGPGHPRLEALTVPETM